MPCSTGLHDTVEEICRRRGLGMLQRVPEELIDHGTFLHGQGW